MDTKKIVSGLRTQTIEHWCSVLREHRANVIHVSQENGK